MDSGVVISWKVVMLVGLMQGGVIVVMLICAWALAQTCWRAQKLHAEAEDRLLAVSEKLLMATMAAGPGTQPELAGRALEETRTAGGARPAQGVAFDPTSGLMMHSGLPVDPPSAYVGASG